MREEGCRTAGGSLSSSYAFSVRPRQPPRFSRRDPFRYLFSPCSRATSAPRTSDVSRARTHCLAGPRTPRVFLARFLSGRSFRRSKARTRVGAPALGFELAPASAHTRRRNDTLQEAARHSSLPAVRDHHRCAAGAALAARGRLTRKRRARAARARERSEAHRRETGLGARLLSGVNGPAWSADKIPPSFYSLFPIRWQSNSSGRSS